MSTSIALAAPTDVFPLAADTIPTADWRERAAGWAGAALSVAVLVAVMHKLGGEGIGRIATQVTLSPLFWAVFALAYLASPLCEWVIFRRLWRLPQGGLLALLRKEVSNELLFGYSGEAHFYLWARRHVLMTASPFGAVKDVAVLSAAAGNLATLVLMAATAPMLADFADRPGARALAGSVAIAVVISLAMFLFRRAVFSLSARELRMIFAVHCVRITAHVGLAAVLWHLLVPTVPLSGVMALATVRQMVSRLPLVANKDILFAGVALFLVGDADGVAGAIATVSSLALAAHLVVGALAWAGQFAVREQHA